MKGYILLIIVILGSFIICFSASAEPIKKEKSIDEIETYKKAIEESKNNEEKALFHKKLGDLFVSKKDFKNASEEFIKAISLYRGFSEKERLQMAIYISWGDRVDEAISELKIILSENPGNIDARAHLARCLSWSGKLKEAIEEADRVLKESPENTEAMLIKANALRWKGDLKAAIPIYKKLLVKEEDFDARLGLAYAYLLSGNKKRLEESIRLLKPQYPYQEREFKKLVESAKRETRSYLDIRYNYYHDSDDNRFNRYWLGYGFWAGNWKLDFSYRHTDAKDNVRDNRAEDLFFKAYSKVTESIGIGGGLGLLQFANDNTTNFLTWNIKADINILNGVVGTSLAREGFTDTAQLIENKIRFTNASFYISQGLTDRLSLYGSYSYRDYSDNNSANDFLFSPSYILYIKKPVIKSGYRFRYLDFERQSGSGYFDPSDFISHQVFVSLYLEREKFYCYLEPYAGYQSFKRNGKKTDDFFGGGYGTFGYGISENASFEMNAEGGNYALGTAAGWEYYLIGLRLVIYF
jgi:tetratricopeptide (TPR) repeat protein